MKKEDVKKDGTKAGINAGIKAGKLEEQGRAEDIKNNTRYFIAAGILFIGILACFVGLRFQKEDRTGYDVVVFGDSVMGLCRDETSVTAVLQEMTGKRVYNAAFGGTCMAVRDVDLEYNYTMTLLNMVSLSKALSADDFGAQQTVRSRRDSTDYFAEVLEELPRIDFAKVQTVVIAFGLNDYHSGIPVDNADKPFDENTYGGALRSVLRTLRKTYPEMRILLVTPTYTWYLSNGLTCEEYETGEAFLEEYVRKELEIAEEFDIPVIDLYHEGYEHEKWEDWSRFTIDGLHPNEESRRMIAERIAAIMDIE